MYINGLEEQDFCTGGVKVITNNVITHYEKEKGFKSNFYNVTSFSSVEMMDELTMNYINWYNYVRPHSYNDYLTPMEARYR